MPIVVFRYSIRTFEDKFKREEKGRSWGLRAELKKGIPLERQFKVQSLTSKVIKVASGIPQRTLKFPIHLLKLNDIFVGKGIAPYPIRIRSVSASLLLRWTNAY